MEKAREFQKNIYLCFTDYAKAFKCVDHNKLWKMLKEMGGHFTCLLGNLYVGQETTFRTRHETMNWFKIEKGIWESYILPLCLFNLYAEYIFEMLGLMNSSWNQDCQERYQQPQICKWYHCNGRKWRGTQEPLDEGQRGEWKSWLETQLCGTWSHHFMANRWSKNGNSNRLSQGPNSHEIKRCLLPGRKAVTNLDSILKGRDITLLTKVHTVKAIFPVVMYGCESWTIKKAEHWRTDAFELWCLRRLLRVPWTARGSNKSILKEINPEYSLEGLMLKLKLEYFCHLTGRPDSLEKTLMPRKIESRMRRGQQRMKWLDGIINTIGKSLSKLWEIVKVREAWSSSVHGITKSWSWISDWTTTMGFLSSHVLMWELDHR